MKKPLFTLILLIASIIISFSQVPDAFSYQAVVRNSSGEIIANQNVSFQISILQESESGIAVYVETHAATTNDFGLANLKVGKGTLVSGVFHPGGWGSAPHFIKIELDPLGGDAFIHLGTSQLLAVPYAFHAETVEQDSVDDADADATNELQTLDLSGTQLTLSNGGGTVTLPSTGGGDNWGTQTVASDATLDGEGTSADPLGVVGDLTDDQTLSIVGNDLTISDGNTIALPAGEETPWNESNDGIQYNSGKVGINHDPADDTGILQVWGDNDLGIEVVSNSPTYPALFAQNNSGSAAYFDGQIEIVDGTEGAGKILTSNEGGKASWATPSSGQWVTDGDDIYFNTGKVGIGTIPGADLRQFQVVTTNRQAIAGQNNSTYPTIYLKNEGAGPAAELRNSIKIADGTEGDGKVLTSSASGLASWQNPSTGLWSQNGDEIYFDDNVGIGTTNPMFNLDISNSSGETYGRIQSTSSSASLILERAGTSDAASIIYKTGGGLYFHTGLLSSSSYKISTTNPILNGLEVEFDGDVKLSDELHSTNTGTANMMPFAYGYITSTGTKSSSTSNVGTVTKSGTGQYKIEIPDLGSDYIVVVTTNHGIAYANTAVTGRSTTFFMVATWDTKNDGYIDAGFSFIVYNP